MGYAFTPEMNDDLVENFNDQTFTQGFAISKKKYYNPKNLIVQHIPVKEREKKMENNRMRNGYIEDTSASVYLQQIIKIGGKLVQNYEGVYLSRKFQSNSS